MSSEIKAVSTPDGNLTLSTSTVTGFHAMPVRHFHDQYEIYYLVSGERFLFVKEKIFRIRKGHFVFIHQNELHRITDTNVADHKRILIYFKRAFLADQDIVRKLFEHLEQSPYWVLSLTVKEQLYIEGLLKDMAEELERAEVGFEACLQGSLLKILAFFSRHFDELGSDSALSHAPQHKKVTQILHYIQEHYSQPLTVPQIAEHFFISPCYLSRIFKKTTGFTLVEYLNNLRVKEAVKLLTHTRQKVIDIAHQTGFGSITQFNRVFKEVMGASPMSFRRRPLG